MCYFKCGVWTVGLIDTIWWMNYSQTTIAMTEEEEGGREGGRKAKYRFSERFMKSETVHGYLRAQHIEIK